MLRRQSECASAERLQNRIAAWPGRAASPTTGPTIILRAMLHHLSLGVRDIDRATAFYDAALAPLGYIRVWSDLRPGEAGQAVGYGPPGGGDKLAIKAHDDARAPGPGFHIAFAAPNRAAVDAFHAAALAIGGSDNGPPGLRPHYGPAYYAAFVIDQDGYPIEAVFKGPA